MYSLTWSLNCYISGSHAHTCDGAASALALLFNAREHARETSNYPNEFEKTVGALMNRDKPGTFPQLT